MGLVWIPFIFFAASSIAQPIRPICMGGVFSGVTNGDAAQLHKKCLALECPADSCLQQTRSWCNSVAACQNPPSKGCADFCVAAEKPSEPVPGRRRLAPAAVHAPAPAPAPAEEEIPAPPLPASKINSKGKSPGDAGF